MKGVLQSADLWHLIVDADSQMEPPKLEAKENDSEERTERIFEREERRRKYFGIRNQCIGKMYRQCTFTIQQLLDNKKKPVLNNDKMKTSPWKPKEMWEALESISDTEQEVNAWLSRCIELKEKFEAQNINFEELFCILILNQLPKRYETIKQIKRNEAKKKETVPTMQSIYDDVKDHIMNR
ncbi:MAG: hypothetical protein Q9200_007617 [Gallowayella weberi]